MLKKVNPRILLSNDDGVHAPGLDILEKIAREISDDVWIVAPETEQSATGHSLTIRRPLRIRKLQEKRFCVDGTPTDSVLLALNEIMKEFKPDLILSGVNRGGNLGEDITYSGTVAAAMEATLLGVPAIALSQYYSDAETIKWSCAEHHGADVVRKMLDIGWPENTLINVNFPDCEADSVLGMKAARQGRRKIGDDLAKAHDPRGEPYYWIGALRTKQEFTEGSDLHAVENKYIAVTPISLDFTDLDTLANLNGAGL